MRTLLRMELYAAQSPLEWRLRWTWDSPLWLTVVLAVCAVLWVTAIYFRESSSASTAVRWLLSALRLAALALAIFMFAQPVLEWFRLGRPRLVALVDRSASMSTPDRYAGSRADVTRIEALKSLLIAGENSLLEQWQSDYDLEILVFDEQSDRLENASLSLDEQIRTLQPVGETSSGTRLGDAIDYALRELPGPSPVALVILSDGISTLGQTLDRAAQRARQLRVPLYTVEVGSDQRRPDVAVEDFLVEEIVFPGDRMQVEAKVRATGYRGKEVEVVLQDEQQGELARSTLKLPTDGATETVLLAIRPIKPGQLQLKLAIEPLDGETHVENNFVQQVVDVRDEKIRVLLMQSQPSYEYRALKSMLQRDPAVELRTLLQEADADFAAVDDTAVRGFPYDENDLFDYDVLMLGDVDLGLLPRSVWPMVEKFVTVHGGGLVGIAGPRFMPLAFRGVQSMELLLPMALESMNPQRSQSGSVAAFNVYPTSLGWRTPSLLLGESTAESERVWQALPRVNWILQVDDVKPGAQVLAEHPGITNRQGRPLPLIIRHYVGAGEVLFHAMDETWRWRYRSDDRYFARYWGQVVRRLGRGRLASGRAGVQLTAGRTLYKPGETVELQARFRNPAQAPSAEGEVVVRLQGILSPSREIVMQRRLGRRGIFAARVENLEPGEYQALLLRPDLGGPADVARFEIRQPPRELAQLVVNRQGLKQAAETSGGRHYTLANAEQLREELPPPRKQTIDALPPRPLWNSYVIIALFVVALTGEWLLRRRHGML